LYFRLLKKTDVFPLLTKYLLLYKRVCIPCIGTFEIVQQSPQLSVGEKLFSPPSFTTRHLRHDAVPEHQFDFFASSAETEKEKLRQELFLFGENFRRRIQKDPFQWNGFGILRFSSNEIVFEPLPIKLPSLASLPAEKIIRENVQHSVLVGDQQMTSKQVNEVLNKASHKKPLFLTIGWILLIVALITIIILLYFGKFQTTVSGLKSSVVG